MLHIVTNDNFDLYRAELDQAFQLRHKVFVEEKNWTELAREDGRETDRFDDEHAIHMLFVADGRVIGYQRMLPSTRPHLLTNVLSNLCEGTPPVGPNIWEWSRYCVEADVDDLAGCPNQDVGVPDRRHTMFDRRLDADRDLAHAKIDRCHAAGFGKREERPRHQILRIARRNGA